MDICTPRYQKCLSREPGQAAHLLLSIVEGVGERLLLSLGSTDEERSFLLGAVAGKTVHEWIVLEFRTTVAEKAVTSIVSSRSAHYFVCSERCI